MAYNIFSKLTAVSLRLKPHPAAFSALSSGCSLTVQHDRQNRRFTVAPGSGAGKQREPGMTLRSRGRSLKRARRPVAALAEIHKPVRWIMKIYSYFSTNVYLNFAHVLSVVFLRRENFPRLHVKIYEFM